MIPTWRRFAFAARVAVESAVARPLPLGYETRTIVQPFTFAGHSRRPFGRAGAPGSGAEGRVAVLTVAGEVDCGTAGSPIETAAAAVRTTGAALRWRFVITIAAAAPATATSSVNSESQTQSPGYQPSRRSQRRRSAGTAPATIGSLSPQSR